MTSNSTRQAGEAVAWRVLLLGRWHLTDKPSRVEMERSLGEAPEPLIPASDLEQVSRERDEAVRLLREYAKGMNEGDWQRFDARVAAFLNTGEPG